jgi:hypothetical protein
MAKLSRLFIAVFGGFGLTFLAIGGFLAHSSLAFRDGAQSAEGRVIELDGGKPVVEFDTPDGTHRVTGSVSSDPPAYEVGENVTVWYPPDAPEAARIDGWLERWFLPTLFGGLGAVFAGIALGFLVAARRRRRLHEWLRQFGTKVQAKYTGVMHDTSVRINGRHPWRLTAQWQHPATGIVHVFESDTLFFDPSDYVRGETVDVWIDPNDPRRHHLDTDFLPKAAE